MIQQGPKLRPGTRPPKVLPRRVQRPTDALPVLHLENDIPERRDWIVGFDGLVEAPRVWTLQELQELVDDERTWDLHCVWGWSHPNCVWRGVSVGWLLDRVRPKPQAAYALVRAAEGRYASCLTLDEARESMIALELDGHPLSPEQGGPLRFVPPPRKWAYKGVKWVGEVFLLQTFTPGFWETLVGNPHGDVPPEMLDLRFE